MEPRRSQRINFQRNPVRYGSWVGDEQENALAFGRLLFRDGGSSSRSSQARYLQAVLDEKTCLAAAEQTLKAAQLEELQAKVQAERELSDRRLAVEAARLTDEGLLEEDVIQARLEEWRTIVGSLTLPKPPTVEEQDVMDHCPLLSVPGRVTPIPPPRQHAFYRSPMAEERRAVHVDHLPFSLTPGKVTPIPAPRQRLSQPLTVGEQNVLDPPPPSAVPGRVAPISSPRLAPPPSLTVEERSVVDPSSSLPLLERVSPVPRSRQRTPTLPSKPFLPEAATMQTVETFSPGVARLELESVQRNLEQEQK